MRSSTPWTHDGRQQNRTMTMTHFLPPLFTSHCHDLPRPSEEQRCCCCRRHSAAQHRDLPPHPLQLRSPTHLRLRVAHQQTSAFRSAQLHNVTWRSSGYGRPTNPPQCKPRGEKTCSRLSLATLTQHNSDPHLGSVADRPVTDGDHNIDSTTLTPVLIKTCQPGHPNPSTNTATHWL